MGLLDGFAFKVADQPWEFEAIHALNYSTFVQEIPQHSSNHQRKLVDKYHEENTYVICVNDNEQRLAGMVACRDKRPFSLDEKLGDLDSYLPYGRSPCEIRLLAVDTSFRFSHVLQELLATLARHVLDRGYDLALISGTTRQAKLYEYLGFVPFGPLIGTQDASFQPMYATLEAFRDLQTRSRSFAESTAAGGFDGEVFNFQHGPVDLPKQVKDAYSKDPSSHRSDAFARDFQRMCRLLCDLVNANDVEILMGTGTLANDAVAGQLSLLDKPGLILVSGEFGRRLARHASGANLSFQTLEISDGQSFQPSKLECALKESPEVGWIWGTHCETSTGVLEDLAMYKEVCAENNIKLCLDCISSVGTVPVDLSGVYLASASSGKGLASISGLSMVFHNHGLQPAAELLPPALDLGNYQASDGIPYTIQSNLVHALIAALETHNWKERFENVRSWSQSIRRKLDEIDAPALAPDSNAMPAVVTIPLPQTHSSKTIGGKLGDHGVLVSYLSDYLFERNWIQACVMGVEAKSPEKLVRILKEQLAD